uniref:Uncharacterized protein n=1 Tax=Anaerobacillus isosaccharinicus TaxID=1532552 RepID=A0A1S2LH79_9BACI
MKSFDSIHIDIPTWNGDDILYPTGLPGTILTSEKFYDFIKKYKFTNINLIPAKEYKSKWY